MRPVTYRNTKTDLPRWTEPLHELEPRGYAYEHDTHFIYIYGKASGLWTISSGLTISEMKSGDLGKWLDDHFGPDDKTQMLLDAGEVVRGVWRPGLYYQDQTLQALGWTEYELRSAEQALRLLVERLDELLLYVEPSANGLASYSHKSRELLILACTEVENQWKQYLTLANYSGTGRVLNTKDYVRLCPKLYLSEFEITLRQYAGLGILSPFRTWNAGAPTQSIPWYDSYNKTKHDRANCFTEATVVNCLSAVAANIVLFCARFGPFFLLHGVGPLSSLMSQHFAIEWEVCT